MLLRTGSRRSKAWQPAKAAQPKERRRTFATSLRACLSAALSLLTPTPPSPPAASRLPSFSNSTSSLVLRCRNFFGLRSAEPSAGAEGAAGARPLPFEPLEAPAWGARAPRGCEDEPGTAMGTAPDMRAASVGEERGKKEEVDRKRARRGRCVSRFRRAARAATCRRVGESSLMRFVHVDRHRKQISCWAGKDKEERADAGRAQMREDYGWGA